MCLIYLYTCTYEQTATYKGVATFSYTKRGIAAVPLLSGVLLMVYKIHERMSDCECVREECMATDRFDTGKIALVRYGKLYRGTKVLLAQER